MGILCVRRKAKVYDKMLHRIFGEKNLLFLLKTRHEDVVTALRSFVRSFS